jgi:hypothetical protein
LTALLYGERRYLGKRAGVESFAKVSVRGAGGQGVVDDCLDLGRGA